MNSVLKPDSIEEPSPFGSLRAFEHSKAPMMREEEGRASARDRVTVTKDMSRREELVRQLAEEPELDEESAKRVAETRSERERGALAGDDAMDKLAENPELMETILNLF